MCEKSVKIGHFSHVFHMVFHIHTPSSVWCIKLLGIQPACRKDKLGNYKLAVKLRET